MKIGQTTTDREMLGKRDAFHCPCILVSTTETLAPGDDVRFVNMDLTVVTAASKLTRQGVIDPFIEGYVGYGTDQPLFWVCLMPNLIKNLTHHFELADTVEEDESLEEDCGDCDDEESTLDPCRNCET